MLSIFSEREMLTNSRDIKRRLEQGGWILERVAGSHHVFKHPQTRATVVYPIQRKTWGADWFVISISKLAGSPIESAHGLLRCHR